MKSRGFDLERSAVTHADRLERLFGLVTLAWVCCLRGMRPNQSRSNAWSSRSQRGPVWLAIFGESAEMGSPTGRNILRPLKSTFLRTQRHLNASCPVLKEWICPAFSRPLLEFTEAVEC
ncbi:hypothetical protein [Deinococcus saxicola]|uniref:hypothetical protein n=1 Tax=Deinococcus saxicola TaxID=249406 RepID=UPI0039EF0FFE